jgi:hypothetical protein
MKFGDLINSKNNVLIVAHLDFDGVDRMALADLMVEYDLFIATVNIKDNPVEIVQHVKHTELKVNAILYCNGKFKDRFAFNCCHGIGDFIKKNLN